jgi:preprotein translocase subunit SecG
MIFWRFARRQVVEVERMDALFSVILVVHILIGLAVCGLVLMQHGKGADMGAAFGSGASGSLFGATGSSNFLSHTTAVLAAIFFSTSLALAYIASNKPKTSGSVMENAVQSQPLSAPVPKGEQAAENKAAAPGLNDSKTKDIPK